MKNIGKRIGYVVVALIAIVGITGCGATKKEADTTKKTIKYGKAAGPYTILFEDAIKPILEEKGYTLEAVEVSDLLISDTAINDGEIEFNVEQHTAYMENFNANQKGNLAALKAIPTVPAGIFSSNKTSLEEIKQGAKIALPSDASNAARGYVLLQKAGWITLKDGVELAKATKEDIANNPYQLELIEMDSSYIPQSLDEFDYAVIPGSIVYNAKIDASTVLLQEDVLPHLLLQIVINKKNKDTQWAKDLVEAYSSEKFNEYLEKNNNGLWFVPES